MRATCVSIAASLALLGCATPDRIADSVVTANLAQEVAGNRMLLLNIVRASLYRPLYFSKANSIHLPISGPLSKAELALGLGPGQSGRARSASVGLDGAGDIDVGPVDSKEFIEGLVTPMSPEWLVYFASRSLSPPDKTNPTKTLLTLFLDSIGPNRSLSEAWKSEVERLSKCTFSLAADQKPVGADFNGTDSAISLSLVDAQKEGFKLSRGANPGTFRMESSESILQSACDGDEPKSISISRPTNGQIAPIRRLSASPAKFATPATSMTLRSPEQMIAFLGAAKRNLFIQIETGNPPSPAVLQVAYEGATYWVTDRSTLDLIYLLHDVLLLKGANISSPDSTTVNVQVR